MARTGRGARLTAQHKDAQLKVRAAALRAYMRLWPLWQGDDRSFDSLVVATLPLVQVHHRLSASVALAYYETFRTAEGATGNFTPRLADDIDTDQVAASLFITGRNMTRKAIDAGFAPAKARQVALVRTSGTVSRHVLSGGRDSLVATATADDAAAGYKRVTPPGACSFCRGLAAKGTHSDDFRAHDHCGCSAEPDFT